MRCKSCDKLLTDPELKAKDPNTGDYLDMCARCSSWHEVATGDVPYVDTEHVHGKATGHYVELGD